jgi:hypothetical protein
MKNEQHHKRTRLQDKKGKNEWAYMDKNGEESFEN